MTVSSAQFKTWLSSCHSGPNQTKPFIVGISGGSGSGKTTIAQLLHEYGGIENTALILQDSYYHDQSSRFDGDGNSVNFDHPSALDFDLLAKHLAQLKSGLAVDVPIYDFSTHKRLARTVSQPSKPLIILDGILILNSPVVRKELDYSAFVKTSEKLRFQRRLERDVKERGRTPEGVEKQFALQVKPMHDQFVEPSQVHAHFIADGEAWVMTSFDLLMRDLWGFMRSDST